MQRPISCPLCRLPLAALQNLDTSRETIAPSFGLDENRQASPEPNIAFPKWGLKVFTLYSQSAASERQRFTSLLQSLLGGDSEMHGSVMSFDELHEPLARVDPAGEVAHVIVLITRADEDIPLHVRSWISSWLRQIHEDSALVCLLAGGLYRESRTWHELHTSCNAAGVSFFASGFRSEMQDRPQETSQTQTLPLAYKSFSGVPHWGINE